MPRIHDPNRNKTLKTPCHKRQINDKHEWSLEKWKQTTKRHHQTCNEMKGLIAPGTKKNTEQLEFSFTAGGGRKRYSRLGNQLALSGKVKQLHKLAISLLATYLGEIKTCPAKGLVYECLYNLCS